MMFVLLLFIIGGTVNGFQLPSHFEFNSKLSSPVDPDYSWRNRRTGIVPEWKIGSGFWQHYHPNDLLQTTTQEQQTSLFSQTTKSFSSNSGDDDVRIENNNNDRPISVRPYTQGLMRKHLRARGPRRFDLWSVYQPEAQGRWLQDQMTLRPQDGLLEHQYQFHQRPYRIDNKPPTTPGASIPQGWDSTSRAVIVQPNSCTIAGTLWVPTVQQQEQVLSQQKQQEANQERTEGKDTKKNNEKTWTSTRISSAILRSKKINQKQTLSSSKLYERIHQYELWLAEEYNGVQEGRKVGVFIEYDGVTGMLKQLFQIHEIALLDPNNSNDDLGNNENMEHPTTISSSKNIPRTQPQQQSHFSPAHAIDLRQDEGIHPEISQYPSNIIHEQTIVDGRIVHFFNQDSNTDDDIENKEKNSIGSQLLTSKQESKTIKNNDNDDNNKSSMEFATEFSSLFTAEIDVESSVYLNLKLDNGVLLKVPRYFNQELDGPLLLEFSCTRADGDCHRVVVVGNRRDNGFDTVCYERWSPTTTNNKKSDK